MSIAEKLVTIAENEKRVYEAGKNSVIDKSKIITNTVSANTLLHITDVSEIPHTIKINLTSDTITDFSNTKVTVYGKNLCSKGNWIIGETTGAVWQGNLTGDFTISFDNNITEFTGSEGGALISVDVDGARNYLAMNGSPKAYSGTITAINWHNWCVAKKGSIDNIQLEVGRCYTSYEPYTAKEYTANADGTLEIQSVNNFMNIVTDENINITATYNVSWGIQAANRYFWDCYQTKGARQICIGSFAGEGWHNETFKPMYDLKPTRADKMFFQNGIVGDLVEICENLGIILDFSQCVNTTETFSYDANRKAYLTRLGVIDFSSSNGASSTFRNARSLVTIDKIISHNNLSYNYTFINCTALQNITFEGTIAKNISFVNSSKLTHDSLISIINALSDETADTTATFSLEAVNTAFETAEGLADGSTSEEWLNLIATKSNWTITLS